MSTIFLSDDVITLANGVTGQPWQVETANPVNFYQAVSEPHLAPSADIYAQTFLPTGIDNPAVVIVVPGSLGVAPSHIAKAVMLTDAGIACCLLDPFGNRGVASTVADQAQFSFAASAWDVLAAVEQISSSGDIDPARIGAQGHSRGGSAVLTAAAMARLTGFRGRLAAVYAAYPWCGMQFLKPDVGQTRIRSIIGDQDEWSLPQQVQGYMHSINLCGGNASIKIVAGAHHSFDRDTPIELVADASVAPAAPTIYIDEDGACIHPVDGHTGPQTSERDLMLYGIKAGYGVHGARIGSTGDEAARFHEDMMDFWQDCF